MRNGTYRKNQRATYRVAPLSSREPKAWVGLEEGPVEAVLDDISARGCGLYLPQEVLGQVEVEASVTLRLAVGGTGMPQLFIRGTIRGIREEDERVRLGIAFEDPERLYTQLREPQWRYFNRRGAFRVPPADERGRPLRATFEIPGAPEPRSFALFDLSSSGLSIALRPPNEATFPKHLPVTVTFTLPGDAESTVLRVLFVHRTVIDGRTRFGFRIDEARTEDVDEVAEKIIRYVMERQQQLLLSKDGGI